MFEEETEGREWAKGRIAGRKEEKEVSGKERG